MHQLSSLISHHLSCNRVPGLLNSISTVLKDLALDVGKAAVGSKDGDDSLFRDRFFVQKSKGGKVTDSQQINEIVTALEIVLKAKANSSLVSRPKFESKMGDTNRLQTMMDTYLKNDVLSIQSDIINHVEYTMARSRYKFDDFEAYQATSLSLRDRLIERWNDTQTYFK